MSANFNHITDQLTRHVAHTVYDMMRSHDASIVTVSDLVRASFLSRETIQEGLDALVSIGAVDKPDFGEYRVCA